VSRPAPKPAAGLCRRQPTLLRRHQAPGDRARDHRVEATGRFAARQRCIGQAVPLNTNVTTRFRTTLAGSWTAPACASQTTPPTSPAPTCCGDRLSQEHLPACPATPSAAVNLDTRIEHRYCYSSGRCSLNFPTMGLNNPYLRRPGALFSCPTPVQNGAS
jgi:hypothetical protein